MDGKDAKEEADETRDAACNDCSRKSRRVLGPSDVPLVIMKPSSSQSRFNFNGLDENDDRGSASTVGEKTVVRKACVTEATAQRRRRAVLLLLIVMVYGQ